MREEGFEEWASAERRRYHSLACEALTRLGAMELDAGRPAEALNRAEACIRRDIFREEAHRLAIEAFVALGRRRKPSVTTSIWLNG